MKAHIISLSRGSVQIGATVFQPFANKRTEIPEFDVAEESMEEAKRVLVEYLKNTCKNEKK
ncbi:MAG: hypothetical protein JXB88_16905 [Spirochaetales bacterium]|nr:hypothetical protein [Spirochaetales bacterium]